MLTEKDAAIAFAKAWNNLDCSEFLQLLAEDAHYASQYVFNELESKAEISEYLTGKMQTIKNEGETVRAELAIVHRHILRNDAVFLTQGKNEETKALILFKIKDDKISRYDLCIHRLYRIERTGVYPV